MVNADNSAYIVLQNGSSIPISAVSLQEDKLLVTTTVGVFTAGQSFALAAADHVYGEKPQELNEAIALVLLGQQNAALKLLEPMVVSHQATAKIPGNFWLEAARMTLIAYALNGNTAKCGEIGPRISEATPTQGVDPFVSLSKALLMPSSTAPDISEIAFRDLTTENLPAEVCAFASFYRGNLLKKLKRNTEAFEAFLSVSTLYPSGGIIVNAVAELQASDFLVDLGRREEAILLLKSSMVQSMGTPVTEEANKRLEKIK